MRTRCVNYLYFVKFVYFSKNVSSEGRIEGTFLLSQLWWVISWRINADGSMTTSSAKLLLSGNAGQTVLHQTSPPQLSGPPVGSGAVNERRNCYRSPTFISTTGSALGPWPLLMSVACCKFCKKRFSWCDRRRTAALLKVCRRRAARVPILKSLKSEATSWEWNVSEPLQIF